MSNKTNNFSLTLPLQEELYDVDIFNENFTVVDENLGLLNSRLKNLAEVSKTGRYNHLINRPWLICRNTNELRQALAVNERNIFLMPGEYVFNENNLDIYYPVNIRGCGEDTVINLTGKGLNVSGDNVTLEGLRLVKEDSGSMVNITITSGYKGIGKNFRLRDCSFKCDGESGMICKTNTFGEMFFIDGCVFDFGGELIYKGLSAAYANVSGFISNSYARERVNITNELPYPQMLIVNGCFNIERQV